MVHRGTVLLTFVTPFFSSPVCLSCPLAVLFPLFTFLFWLQYFRLAASVFHRVFDEEEKKNLVFISPHEAAVPYCPYSDGERVAYWCLYFSAAVASRLISWWAMKGKEYAVFSLRVVSLLLLRLKWISRLSLSFLHLLHRATHDTATAALLHRIFFSFPFSPSSKIDHTKKNKNEEELSSAQQALPEVLADSFFSWAKCPRIREDRPSGQAALRMP